MNQKNGKKFGAKNMLIISLLLIIILLVGYLLFDKYYDKKDNKEEKNNADNTQVEVLDVTSKEVTSLFDSLNNLALNDKSEAYYGYLYKQDELKVDDMQDDFIIANILYKEYLECGDKCVQKSSSENGLDQFVISSELIKQKVSKIFGNIIYNDTNIKAFDCQGDFKYDNNSNNYVHELAGCGYGLENYNKLETFITKAVKQDDSLDIYVKPAFEYIKYDINNDGNGEINNTTITVYKDYNKTSKLYETKEIEYKSNDMLEKYGNQLSTYVIHFENENGEYHFKNIKKNS